MWKTHLNFKGCKRFKSKWTARSGNKKMLFMDLRKLFKGAQHSCERAQQSVSSSWPPLLPSHGQMFVRTNLAALLLCVVYLYTVVQPRLKAQTLSIFIDFFCPICTVYILYLKPVGNMYFSIRTDWNEWMFMYSIPTVVHLCCTRAWWGPGEAAQHCFETSAKTLL